MITAANRRPRPDFIRLGKATLKNIKGLISLLMSKSTRQINPVQGSQLQSVLDDIARRPMDHLLHFKLAKYFFSIGRIIPTIAECRTSLALGNEDPAMYRLLGEAYIAAGCSSLAEDLFVRGVLSAKCFRDLKKEYGADTDGLLKLSSITYQRLQVIKTRINQWIPDPHVRILDVGGGEGQLCLFLPNAQYVLADPAINGIMGQSRAFAEKSFDIVVACHVLEHIPNVEKENFLETLCLLAKDRIILLVPVGDDGYAAQADALIHRITQASWAMEHLKREMPTLEMLREFANRRGLDCNITRNGDRAAVFWMVFASHYASIAGRTDELSEIAQFSNRYLNESISNPNQPNDYLVEFYVDKSSAVLPKYEYSARKRLPKP